MQTKTSRTTQPKLPPAGRSWPMRIVVPDDVSQMFAAGGAEFLSSPAFQISNRHFLVRLETSVIRRKQTPGASSNRHFWEGRQPIMQCLEDAGGGNFLCLASSQNSNRRWLARLENLSNSLKIKAGDDF
jgi:hypothetical protein